jgi:hypothetical protein
MSGPDDLALVAMLTLWPPRLQIWWSLLFRPNATRRTIERLQRLARLTGRYPVKKHGKLLDQIAQTLAQDYAHTRNQPSLPKLNFRVHAAAFALIRRSLKGKAARDAFQATEIIKPLQGFTTFPDYANHSLGNDSWLCNLVVQAETPTTRRKHMAIIVGVSARTVRHAICGARKRLNLKASVSKEILRSGGEDGSYRITLANGTIVEATVGSHINKTEIHWASIRPDACARSDCSLCRLSLSRT